MRVSKFIKANKDILLEYIYDDGNNIGDPYDILVNLKDNSFSYIAGQSSGTGNIPSNQLFKIDGVTNNYGLVDSTNYSFLQLKDYASGFPLRHDIIKIHLPINYTFGEYLGCYIKVYAFDYDNKITYDLSNFFFDATNVDQSYLLGYTAPPLLFQEKLWGKEIVINIPSTYAIANQRQNGYTKANSVNYNLTNGSGLSLNSPIFIDFHFITSKKTVNKVTTYYLTTKTPISLPQSPDFEKVGVMIQHSKNGDFFEVYGTFNGNIAEFNNFILNSVQLGNRYYVTYTITLYEQNIRGKTLTITVTDNFNETIEYRPIIKYSTTTAIIDVEMNLIDAVDESSTFRRASYGMLQDEVAKYSLNLTKINLANANKPKIYNIKSPEGAGIFGNNGSTNNQGNPQVVLEPIKINYTVLADKFNLVAKSDNVLIGKTTFFGIGKLQIVLHPFDNVVQLRIAQDVSNDQKSVDSGNGSNLEYVAFPNYMDMTNMGEIKMIIKNQQLSVEMLLYMASNAVDLSNGNVVFNVPASKMNDVRKIYDSGINVFYITSTLDTSTTVIYSGLFLIYDSTNNVINMNNTVAQINSSLGNNQQPSIINDPNSSNKGTAIVTRKVIGTPAPKDGSINTTNSTSTSTSNQSATKISGKTYAVSSNSELIIDGYNWTSTQLKSALNLSSAPTNLKIQSDSLYTNGKYLDKLINIDQLLQSIYLDSSDKKTIHSTTQTNYKNNEPK